MGNIISNRDGKIIFLTLVIFTSVSSTVSPIFYFLLFMNAQFRDFRDFFQDNLLSNVPEALSAFGISESSETLYKGVSSLQVASWEWEHQVKLPRDLRNFYRTTNGYLYTWTGKTVLTKYPTLSGRIEVNDLRNLVETKGFIRRRQPQFRMTGLVVQQIEISEESKVFVLCNIDGGLVVLAYMKRTSDPFIMVCTQCMELFYIAKDFTTYMELATYYMGIPGWELMYTTEGAPKHTIILFRALKPHILAYTNKFSIYQKAVKNSAKDRRNFYRSNHKSIFIKYNGVATRRSKSSPGSFSQDNEKDEIPVKSIRESKNGMVILFPIEYKLCDLPLFSNKNSWPGGGDCFNTLSSESSDSDLSGCTSVTYPSSKRERKARLRRKCAKKENEGWFPLTNKF